MKQILEQIARELEETVLSVAAWENILGEQMPLAPGRLRDERERAAVALRKKFETLRRQIGSLPQ